MHGRQWVSDVVYQPIVDNVNCVVGFECLARMYGGLFTEQFVSMADPSKLDAMMTEVMSLIQWNMRASTLLNSLENKKLFVNAEKCNLANPVLVDRIILFAEYLAARNIMLVIEVTERKLQSCCSFRSYIEGVRRLVLGGILIALDDFLLDEHSRTELELGLCQIVKIEVDALPLSYDVLCGAAKSDGCIEIRQSLETFALLYKVELLLERVEPVFCMDLLTALPFRYFQGYRFGAPGSL